MSHDESALQRLAQRLSFDDLSLLRRALTHRSFLNENPEFTQDNERLEFLGDAILDFIVGDWLYQSYPEMDEGKMTQTRSVLVRTDRLARFARNLSLGEALLLGRGEENNGGRNRAQLLCDAFEALIGALYLDQGIERVRAFILPFLQENIDEALYQIERLDPKSTLQNWAQKENLGTPHYRIVDEEGPDHNKVFTAEVYIRNTFYGRGQGSSKHQAEEAAALAALQEIGLL